MDQSTFFFISLSGLVYFLIAKRRFDYFTLTYFSAVFYFSPGFVGFVPTYLRDQTEAIVPETYLIMNVVLGAMLSAAALFDTQFGGKKIELPKPVVVETEKIKFVVTLLLLVATFSALGNFLIIDRSLLAGGVEKADLLSNNTSFYNLWVYTSLLALFYAYYLGHKLYLVIAFCLLLIDTYFYAMRVHIVLALMAIVFHRLYSEGPVRLFTKIHYAFLLTPFILFFFIFKSLMRPLNEGNYSLFFDRLFDPQTYMYWLVRAEPFNQVAILNKIVVQDFVSPASHLLISIVSIIPYSGRVDFGINQRFHDYFYPVLYPNMKIGAIASNPWAQLVSTGDFLMLLCGIMAFLILIYTINYKIILTKMSITNLVLFSLAPVICFYMHRNDLYFTLLMSKRFILPVLAIYLIRLFLIKSCRKG